MLTMAGKIDNMRINVKPTVLVGNDWRQMIEESRYTAF